MGIVTRAVGIDTFLFNDIAGDASLKPDFTVDHFGLMAVFYP